MFFLFINDFWKITNRSITKWAALSENGLHIDERNHEPVPTVTERLTHALFSTFLGFALINIIAFWMFPGMGLGAIYMLSGYHAVTSIASSLVTVLVYTLLILCFVFGWFQGKIFTSRLKHYINSWKFW